jgi:hypothetical protein
MPCQQQQDDHQATGHQNVLHETSWVVDDLPMIHRGFFDGMKEKATADSKPFQKMKRRAFLLKELAFP